MSDPPLPPEIMQAQRELQAAEKIVMAKHLEHEAALILNKNVETARLLLMAAQEAYMDKREILFRLVYGH